MPRPHYRSRLLLQKDVMIIRIHDREIGYFTTPYKSPPHMMQKGQVIRIINQAAQIGTTHAQCQFLYCLTLPRMLFIVNATSNPTPL